MILDILTFNPLFIESVGALAVIVTVCALSFQSSFHWVSSSVGYWADQPVIPFQSSFHWGKAREKGKKGQRKRCFQSSFHWVIAHVSIFNRALSPLSILFSLRLFVPWYSNFLPLPKLSILFSLSCSSTSSSTVTVRKLSILFSLRHTWGHESQTSGRGLSILFSLSTQIGEAYYRVFSRSFQSSFHWAPCSNPSPIIPPIRPFNPLFIERNKTMKFYKRLLENTFNPLFIEATKKTVSPYELIEFIFQSSFHWGRFNKNRNSISISNYFQSSFHWASRSGLRR